MTPFGLPEVFVDRFWLRRMFGNKQQCPPQANIFPLNRSLFLFKRLPFERSLLAPAVCFAVIGMKTSLQETQECSPKPPPLEDAMSDLNPLPDSS